ncbi:MAG: hypothetical protein R2865_13150 [Deinococcales bacterium]
MTALLAALQELCWAYLRAAISLIPISCLALLFTIPFISGVGGALATVALLIVMSLF